MYKYCATKHNWGWYEVVIGTSKLFYLLEPPSWALHTNVSKFYTSYYTSHTLVKYYTYYTSHTLLKYYTYYTSHTLVQKATQVLFLVLFALSAWLNHFFSHKLYWKKTKKVTFPKNNTKTNKAILHKPLIKKLIFRYVKITTLN